MAEKTFQARMHKDKTYPCLSQLKELPHDLTCGRRLASA